MENNNSENQSLNSDVTIIVEFYNARYLFMFCLIIYSFNWRIQ
jgi:hypothetical protein